MGGLLGGGSSINFMMYTRAQGIDYDSWETPGWTAKDILPLCKKLETFHQDEPGIDKDKHGYSGPINVSDGGYRGKSEHDFLNTVKKMGYKEIVDLQDLDQCGGFSVSVAGAKSVRNVLIGHESDGNDMFHQMESVKMLLIVISTLCFKMVSIRISISWLNRKSSG